MIFDLELEPMDENTARILWRNELIEQQSSGYDIVKDEMTWNSTFISASITIVSSNPVACNAIGIAGGLWLGQNITLEYNDGVGGWHTVGTWEPRPDVPFLGLFAFQTAAQWRVSYTGLPLLVSVVKIGMALGMQRKTYVGNEPFNKRVNRMPVTQMGAHFVGIQKLQTRREQKYTFNKLDPVWIRAYYKPFMEESKRNSAFVAWRPDEFPSDVIYGFCEDDVKSSNELANGMMQTSFTIEGGLK